MYDEIINRIYSPSIKVKMEALNNLSDILEYGDWDFDSFKSTIEILIKLLYRETSEDIKEIILNAIINGYGSNYYYKRNFNLIEISLDSLIEILPSLAPELYSYVFSILTLTSDKKFIKIISEYENHPNKLISEAAKESLEDF